MINTQKDPNVMVGEKTIDEVLTRWKARVDAYQYDPDKPKHNVSLEEFGEKLLASVKAKQ